MMMTGETLTFLLLTAAVCGAVGELMAGSNSRGWVVSTAMGFVGAWIGMRLTYALALPPILLVEAGFVDYPVVWSAIGSLLLVAVLGLVSPGRR